MWMSEEERERIIAKASKHLEPHKQLEVMTNEIMKSLVLRLGFGLEVEGSNDDPVCFFLSAMNRREVERSKKYKSDEFAVMRRPRLPEDEGRPRYIASFLTEENAKLWIENQKNSYFGPSDYYILHEVVR